MFKNLFSISLVLAVILMFAAAAAAQATLPGKVIDVVDGKTVVVAVSNGKINVELQFIDVPEPGQQLYDTVRDHLRTLVVGKTARYRPITLLRDRTIGRLTVDDVDVSQQMLRDGAAWLVPFEVSGQDKSEFDRYESTEATAKNEKRGIWSIPGLRPAWEIRAEAREKEQKLEQTSYVSNQPTRSAPNARAAMGVGANPSMGNVGALANGYDAQSRTGYVGTSLLGLEDSDKDRAAERKMAVDVSYFYKEDDRKARKGTFVFTLVSVSKKFAFLTHNDLILIVDGKTINIGKPKRTTTTAGGFVRENLYYQVSRATLEKIASTESDLKVNDIFVHPTGIRYLLFTLLQVTQ